MIYRKKEIWLLVIGYGLLVNLSGCAGIKETAKGVAGISTKSLEENRKDAIVKAFNYDYSTCYTKTLDILKRISVYIYLQDIKSHMVAIYVSEEDTTPVGLFFKEIDNANTQIEVSSPSVYAKEFIAAKISKLLYPQGKGEGDEIKEDAQDK